MTLVETKGSVRRARTENGVSAEALHAQGINYYQVKAIGQAATIEKLSF